MNETKVCKVCGESLPTSSFFVTKGGGLTLTCRNCRESKRQQTLKSKRSVGGGVHDPDFDGKTLREVMDIMSRAKRWLESRGCVISLSGEFHETKIRKLKFE